VIETWEDARGYGTLIVLIATISPQEVLQDGWRPNVHELKRMI